MDWALAQGQSAMADMMRDAGGVETPDYMQKLGMYQRKRLQKGEEKVYGNGWELARIGVDYRTGRRYIEAWGVPPGKRRVRENGDVPVQELEAYLKIATIQKSKFTIYTIWEVPQNQCAIGTSKICSLPPRLISALYTLYPFHPSLSARKLQNGSPQIRTISKSHSVVTLILHQQANQSKVWESFRANSGLEPR